MVASGLAPTGAGSSGHPAHLIYDYGVLSCRVEWFWGTRCGYYTSLGIALSQLCLSLLCRRKPCPLGCIAGFVFVWLMLLLKTRFSVAGMVEW